MRRITLQQLRRRASVLLVGRAVVAKVVPISQALQRRWALIWPICKPHLTQRGAGTLTLPRWPHV